MREILFRGKRLDNGAWAYGYLFSFGEGKFKETYILEELDERESIYDIWKCAIKVIPETIGQYTGLTDKNGSKIFENDIVKTQPFYDRPYSDKRKSKQFIGIVEYKIRTFSGNSFFCKTRLSSRVGLEIL